MLAQVAGYSLVHLIVLIIIVAACCGIALIAMRQFGIVVPPFVMSIFWIVACAALAIVAIKFLAGL